FDSFSNGDYNHPDNSPAFHPATSFFDEFTIHTFSLAGEDIGVASFLVFISEDFPAEPLSSDIIHSLVGRNRRPSNYTVRGAFLFPPSELHSVVKLIETRIDLGRTSFAQRIISEHTPHRSVSPPKYD
ncbi:hypothetical protein HK096_010852, partial [Nowakowskiella sp. JEL0078]